MTTEEIRNVRRWFGWWALATVAVTVAVGVDCLVREPVPGQTTPMILLGLLCVLYGALWARLGQVLEQRGERRG
ncbi:hypothetical protein [Pseudonocardia zijingensis]|uniref:Uncharacterized protein n=1 Tax=Pseudonocardia zijingensis TaxID=153376 RepID=A0ABN1N8W6_9PSEU